jgi:hypothetical protein
MIRGVPFEPGNKLGKGRPKGSPNKSASVVQKVLQESADALTRKTVISALREDVKSRLWCMNELARNHGSQSKLKLPLIKTFDDILDSLLVSTRSAGTLYLGFGGYQNPNPSGTFKSIDDGATWVRQPFGVGGFLIVWEMGEDPTNGALYAGTEIADHPQPYHPPFFRSSDGGGTWIDATGPLPSHVIHVAVSAASHAVLAQTEGAGLYKSVDGAQTWRFLNNAFSSALFVDPGDDTRIFGGEIVFRTRNGGAFVSQDSAVHFLPYGLAGQSVAAFAMNGSRTRLYAACYNAGIYVTNLGL